MKNVLLSVLIILFTSFFLNAQADVKKMLKDINGKVDEIIIKSDGKEYRFSGDEAEKLFTSMKDDKKTKHLEFISKNGKVFSGDSITKKITINDLDDDSDDKDIVVFIDDDAFGNLNKIEKKVIVSEKEGEKVVKVTVNEDGKENIEVFEGKAADEYLEKMESEADIKVNVEVNKDTNKKVKKIVIEKEKKTE